MASLSGDRDSLIEDIVSALILVVQETPGDYYYEEVEVKRWILGDGGQSGNCEICDGNAEMGWIDMDDVFDGVDGDVDEPPGHPNCFLAGTSVTAFGVAAATKRWYEGEVLVLRISGVEDLACTPNHPILTQRGWLAARNLKLSDNIAKCLPPTALASVINPNDNYIETSIDKISSSLIVSGCMVARSVPLTTEAFHGDAHVDDKVDIVRAARTFSNDVMLASENFTHGKLRALQLRRIPFPENGSLAQLLHAANHSTNGRIGRCRTCLTKVLRRIFSANNRSILDASLRKPKALPVPQNSSPWDSGPIRDCEKAFASNVGYVKLREIGIRNVRTHVYNLQTATGMYLSNAIVSHNCSCEVEFKTRRERVYV